MTIPNTLDEARILYEQFVKEWETNLKHLNVSKPPAFGGSASLLYTYAYANIGNIFKAKDAIKFAQHLGSEVTDPQTLRHMSNIYGYNARGRSGLMPDGTKVKMGEYVLIDMINTAPGWKGHRKSMLATGDWESIKKSYDYRCVCCGSLEGKPNHKKSGTKTVLEQGHIDPNIPLTTGNIIPQCQICNKRYQSGVVFDSEGAVWALGDTTLVARSSAEVKKEILNYLLDEAKNGKI